MSLQVGARIGPYQVTGVVGAGGMGEVYRAHDTRLQRDVAIKVLPASFAADTERLRRFEQEARAAAALNHPNILTVFDVGTLPAEVLAQGSGTAAAAVTSAPYIVSELLEGASLRERLSAGPLPPRKAIGYAMEIARALAAAHEKGIVHRDLKPDNIFITDDGRAKILDFGLAKLTETAPSELTDAPTMQSATKAGLVLGTLGYMSPEQVRSKPTDWRADIFAFGAVLYEMLSGERAFRGDSAADVMSAILKDEPPDFAAARRDISPALDHIVRHCLEKEPRQRFQSAMDIAFQLQEISSPASSASGARPAMQSGFWTRRRAAFAAIGTTGLLAVAALSYWLGARTGSASIELRQLTFQEGPIHGAKYTPDGENVIFAAVWSDKPAELYSARVDSPAGVRPLGIPATEVLAISKQGEMAVLITPRTTPLIPARLGTVPLGGGSPRPVLDNVVDADWSPDGTKLAVSHVQDGKMRVEYPIGNVLYDGSPWVMFVRVSPDGRHVAFTTHPSGGDDRGYINIVDLEKHHRVLTPEYPSIGSLCWSPDGKEVWYAASASTNDRWPKAVSLDGKVRPLFTFPGNFRLADARQGRVLLVQDDRRGRIMVSTPEHPEERNLAWLDWPNFPKFTRDGKQITFSEQNGPVGPRYSTYIRDLDGSPAARLGEGDGGWASPDGQWLLTRMPGIPQQLWLLPLGAGEARQLTRDSLNYTGGVWLPDSKRLIVTAVAANGRRRSYLMDLNGNGTPFTPEGVAGGLLNSDGSRLLTRDSSGKYSWYPLAGGEPIPVSTLQSNEIPILITTDDRYVIASQQTVPFEIKVFRIELATGGRELLRTVRAAGTTPVGVTQFTMSPDLKSYAYLQRGTHSTLFELTGLH